LTQNSKATMTADDVKTVARTGKPYTIKGQTLTVDEVVAMTSAKDWDGALFELRYSAAYEIADTFNRNHGLRTVLVGELQPKPAAVAA
jgi:hypothetical protein